MTRAVTNDEKTLIRSAGQWSDLFLAVIKPAAVYTARVNQVITSNDRMVLLNFDGGSGTLANVLPGMTMYVGSTAGAYDKGMVRIRKAPTASVFYIGETSDVDFADDDYLTVVDEFGLWVKHPTIVGTAAYMDTDISYVDQHTNREPVVRMGPMVEVLELTGATINSGRVAEAATILGEAVTGYNWSAPGASATANLNTASPTITYNAAGTYRQSCTFTIGGISFTEYRLCYVWDAAHPPVSSFQLKKCEGSMDAGDWSMSVTMFSGADLTAIRDRALVVLFAKDHYGSTLQSIGPVAGFENVITLGWIAGETITQDWDKGTVEFEIKGPGWWMDQKSEFTTGVEITTASAEPTAWTAMKDLTVDLGLWHLLHWRSTVTTIMDIWLTGDVSLAPSTEGAAGSLWSQIRSISSDTILAEPMCNRYGQLYIEVDSQLMAVADRAAIPIVQTLEKVDWQNQIQYERSVIGECSMLDISGVSYDGTTATPIFSRAPGNTFGRHGRPDSQDNLLFASQDQANALAGALYSKKNNEWPIIPVELGGNHRLFDICPRQYAQMSVVAADTIRGFSWTKRLIPRTVSINWNPESGYLHTAIDFEGETIPKAGVTVIPPAIPDPVYPPDPYVPPPYPIIPPIDLPIPDLPPWVDPNVIPGAECRAQDSYPATGPYTVRWGEMPLMSGSNDHPIPPTAYWAPLACWIRKVTATNKTYLIVKALFENYLDPVPPSIFYTFAPVVENVNPLLIRAHANAMSFIDNVGVTWLQTPADHGGIGIFRADFAPVNGYDSAFFSVQAWDTGGADSYINEGGWTLTPGNTYPFGITQGLYTPGYDSSLSCLGIAFDTRWNNIYHWWMYKNVSFILTALQKISFYRKIEYYGGSTWPFPSLRLTFTGGYQETFDCGYWTNNPDWTKCEFTIPAGLASYHVEKIEFGLWQPSGNPWNEAYGTSYFDKLDLGQPLKHHRVTIIEANAYNICARSY